MAILIKGMEMPKNKEGKPLWIGILEDGTVAAPSSSGLLIVYPHAKAIELPPHGRLIDADKLLERFAKEQKAADEHGRDFSFSFYSGNEVCTEWWAVENFVADAPTIIEAEVEDDGR